MIHTAPAPLSRPCLLPTWRCIHASYDTITSSNRIATTTPGRRVHAVFKKMAALQACCRAGGIGTPLAQVLSGTGLHPANPITAQQQSPTNTSLRHAASLGANHNTGKAGRDFFQSAESRPNRGQRRTSTGVRNQSANEADGSARERAPKKKKTGQKDVLWRQAIVEELSKIVAVCACALLFFTAFKFFRGGDLWG